MPSGTDRTVGALVALVVVASSVAALAPSAGASAIEVKEKNLPARAKLYPSGTTVEETCWTPSAAPRPICIHHTATGPHAVSDAYLQSVRSVVDEVWAKEVVEFGYRPPVSDSDSPETFNPNNGLDIFIRDTGAEGYFGSCDTDDPDRKTARKVSAYCSLDNDYSTEQFSGIAPLDALKVTTAHELFHAIQFAYNYKAVKRDPWLVEGTATAMEDEVYDDINAHYAYLWDSQLQQQEIPLDAYGNATGAWADPFDSENFEYGAWLFWRYLKEYFVDVSVIRQVWERSATGASALEAVTAVVQDRQDTFRNVFSIFGLVNSVPDIPIFYEEGPAYVQEMKGHYGPWDATHQIGPSRPVSGSRQVTIDHLSHRYVRFYPETSMAAGAKLTLEVDGPPPAKGGAAWLYVQFQTCFLTFPVELDSEGKGTITAPLGLAECFAGQPHERVFTVWLTATNAGTVDDRVFSYDWSVQP